MPKITISIKRLDGEKRPLEVESGSTVRELKELFSQKMGIDVAQLRLVFKGTPLLDTQTLENAKIGQNDTVHIILQLAGGAHSTNTP
jgi:hypothetical protein